MVKVPKYLQNPNFNFVLLGQWDMWARYEKGRIVEKKTLNSVEYEKINKEIWKPLGKAPFQKAWEKKGLTFNSPELLQHQNNFGIIGGYGRLRILDIDNEVLGKMLEKVMNTATHKTGRGGKHFLFTSDYKTNRVLNGGLGELRCYNYQVVCPPSRHPNGDPYIIHLNKPIREISEKELMGYIGAYLKKENPEQTALPTTKLKDTTRSGREFGAIIKLIESGLSKEKIWEEMDLYSKWATSPEAYRELTYQKALGVVRLKTTKEEAEEEFEIFTDKDLINYVPPEQAWLIENQIPKGEVGLLVGKRGHRKSFIAQLQAICLASKKDVFEDEVKAKKKVFWIDEEMGKSEIAKRTSLLKKGLGIKEALDIKYLSQSGLKLDDPESKKFQKFKKEFLEYKPDICIVDCLQRVVRFEVDKDNASISELFTGTIRPLIKKTGCTFLFIHHLRKSPSGNYRTEDPLDEVRGGSELVNYCRFVLMSKSPSNQVQTSEGGELILFQVLKMSNAQLPEPRVISFTTLKDALIVKYEGIPEEVLAGEVQSSKAIMSYLFQNQITGEFRTSDITNNSEELGFKKTLLSAGLKCLLKEGKLEKIKRGIYRVRAEKKPQEKLK